jgi:hypothetical protein
MTAAVWDKEFGFQFADPTFSGLKAEKFAVTVTEKELKAIASSKGEAPYKRCVIIKK